MNLQNRPPRWASHLTAFLAGCSLALCVFLVTSLQADPISNSGSKSEARKKVESAKPSQKRVYQNCLTRIENP